MACQSERIAKLRKFEQTCDEFEAAWRSGSRPILREFLARCTVDLQSRAFSELLAVEMEYRLSRGDCPTADEYLAQFPEYAAAVTRELASPDQTLAGAGANDPTAVDGRRRGGTVVPSRIGEYELLEEIARGGMGVVYKARQITLDRIVAVKLIRSEGADSAAHIDRFLLEQRTAAGLRHPGIVSIYGGGEHQGQHFYSMEYVEGKTLGIRTGARYSAAEAARIVRDAAFAVQHAHEQGVLHRDLKPSNLMIDRDGRVRVTDFGLAKCAARNSGLTAAGQILGTPSYMSPEQAMGDPDAIDARSDVYSLGAVLYALLTDHPPHEGSTVTATLLSVAHAAPRPPRDREASIPPELEQICLKCLMKSPAHRFQTAAELAGALDRHLTGLSDSHGAAAIQRKSHGTGSRLRTGIAASIVLLSVFLGILTLRVATDQGELVIEAADPQVDLAIANAGVKIHDREGKRAYELKTGEQPLKSGNYVIAVSADDGLRLETKSFSIERNGRVVIKAWLEPAGEPLKNALAPKPAVAEPEMNDRHYDAFDRARIDPYELKVAGAGNAAQAAQELVAILGNSRLQHGATEHIGPRGIAYSPDGRWAASTSSDEMIRLWDPASGEHVRTIDVVRVASFNPVLAFSPDGQSLYLADTALRIWDPQTGAQKRQPVLHHPEVLGLHFNRDGSVLLTQSQDGKSKIWGLPEGKLLATIQGTPTPGPDTQFRSALSDDGSRVYYFDEAIPCVWDLKQGKQVHRIEGLRGGHRFALSPNGRYLACSEFSKPTDHAGIRVWDLQKDELACKFARVGGTGYFDFSSDSRYLVTGGHVNPVNVWDLSAGERYSDLRGGLSDPYWTVFRPDSRQLASISGDARVRLWNLDGTEAFDTSNAPRGFINGLWVTDREIIYRTMDGTMTFHALDGQKSRTLNVTSTCQPIVSSDGKRIATLHPSPPVCRILDSVTGAVSHMIAVDRVEHGSDLAVSPDWTKVALHTVPHGPTTRLVDLSSGKEQQLDFEGAWMEFRQGNLVVRNHTDFLVWDVEASKTRLKAAHNFGWLWGGNWAVSPDGRRMAVSNGRHREDPQPVILFDLNTLARTKEFPSEDHFAFSPDGQLLAGVRKNVVRIWNVISGELERRIDTGFGQYAERIKWSPEGRHLVVANGNGTVFVLRLANAEADSAAVP